MELQTLETRQLLAGAVISEFMPQNQATIFDGDGEFSDWIELHNEDPAPLDIGGYYLTNASANRTLWQIPDGTTLPADGHLLVFASGKDRAVAGQELHTNFELNDGAGYLALVEADGTTIASQYSNYPAVGVDKSYGLLRTQATQTMVDDGSLVRVHVPTGGALGTTWTGEVSPFDDSAGAGWTSGVSPVGFETEGTNFGLSVINVERRVYGGGEIATLAAADALVATALASANPPVPQTYQTIDFWSDGLAGNYGLNRPFPNQSAGEAVDDFVTVVTGSVFVTAAQAGIWTFGVNTDDGSRLRVDGNNVIVDDSTHDNQDRFGQVNLTAGSHEIELVFFERGGGASLELFAAAGSHNTFNAGAFNLIGADVPGALSTGGLAELITTDIGSQMQNVGASAYLRYPFNVTEPSEVSSLLLETAFNDGYAAYLNGTLVAMANSPANPTFDSTSLEVNEFDERVADLSQHLGLLQPGENILAIHGLNSSVADGSFLIRPELSGRAILPASVQTINVPTPGGPNGRVDPIISEFLASNNNALEDEDGDSSDWIELFNPGTFDVNMEGWYLTDDPDDLTRWQFPATQLLANDYLIVFASDKDRAVSGAQLHANFQLDADGDYLALVQPDGQTIAFEYQPGGEDYPDQFEDVSYGVANDGSVADEVLPALSADGAAFTVRQVNASGDFAGQVLGEVGGGDDPLSDVDLLLSLPPGHEGIASEVTFKYDFINFHDNVGGGTNGLFGLDEPFPLDDFNEDDDHFAVQITATLNVAPGRGGDFLIGYNSDEGARLTIDGNDVIVDNSRHFPLTQQATVTLTEGPHTLELVYFEHTGGSALELFYSPVISGEPQEVELIVKADPVPPTIANSTRLYFPTPTPGAANVGGVEAFVGNTSFSVDHGFFEQPFMLEIENDTQGAQIRYTLDGSAPTASNGIPYTGPIQINRTVAIRAAAFLAGADPSPVVAATYLFLDDVLTQTKNVVPQNFPASWGGNTVSYGMHPGMLNHATWGPQMKAALTQIPTMSMVIDTDDLFNSSTGIYANAGNRGRTWERPTSLELIYPPGYDDPYEDDLDLDGFQINAGVRIRGGFSRAPSNPKHAFRLYFRQEYGEAKLNYALFGDEGVDEFDKVDLRTSQNYSWREGSTFQNSTQNNFLRDVFSRDLQGAMGQPYTKSRYYHLYINGHYWGLFQTQERAESRFGASYMGGDNEDYDTIHNNTRDNAAIDGTIDAYQRLYDYFLQPGGLSDSNSNDYWKAQGMNPDGTRNPDYERLLDVDNLITYMIITYYTSDADGPGSKFTRPGLNNYFALFNRENPDGFKFMEHDSEHSLDTGNAAGNSQYNMIEPFLVDPGSIGRFNPQWAHQELMDSDGGNSQYRQRFIDRVTEVLADDGLLGTANAQAMLNTRAAQIDTAIVAEAARWGNHSTLNPTAWQGAVQASLNFVANRKDVLLSQLRAVGWYPDVNPPRIDPNGGQVDPGTIVSLSVAGSEIITDTDLFTENEQVRVLVPPNGNLGSTWTGGNEPFNDGGWISGQNGAGYEDGSGYQNFININVPGRDGGGTNGTTSFYVRSQFFVTNPATIDELVFRSRYDDGFIAYINGVEIARSNAPGTVGTPAPWNGSATALHDDGAAVGFVDFTVGAAGRAAVNSGTNILAVHALNIDANSSDFLQQFELVSRERSFQEEPGKIYYTLDGTDPRGSDDQPSATAISYNADADFLTEGAVGRYLVPNGAASENGWQNPGYDDQSWTTATNGVGYDTGEAEVVGGFSVRVVDTTGTIGNMTIGTDILNGNTEGFTIQSDVTSEQPYLNYGNPGNLVTPPVMPFFGTTDRDDFVIRATANVTIPVGTWTVDVGSDAGFKLTIDGVTFGGNTYNVNGAGSGTGTNNIGYNITRSHSHTGGTFTVFNNPLETTITLDYFERGGGESLELSVAPGTRGSFSGAFNVLRDGQNGWTIRSTGENVDYAPYVNTDLSSTVRDVSSTAYVRYPFTVTNASELAELTLGIRYDDGFVAYLNGTQVAARNAPADPDFDSASTAVRSDFDSVVMEEIVLDQHVGLINEGTNVLAIQILNDAADGPDLLNSVTLSGSYVGQAFPIDASARVIARALLDGEWSPASSAFFTVGQVNMAVTELNYNPHDPSTEELEIDDEFDNDDFEFIELRNTGQASFSTAGIRFTDGIEFDFSGSAITQIQAGEYVLLVRDQEAFETRYGTGLSDRIAGVYTGGLNNDGETLIAVDGSGQTVLEFTYNDNALWPQRADGGGSTLEPIDVSGDYDDPTNWRDSTEYLGTPGAAGVGAVTNVVVVNEVLSHTDPPDMDSIELHNTSDAPVDITGWWLSDSNGDYAKFQITQQTIIPAMGYVVFNESHFNPNPEMPGPNDFGLNGAHGDDVYLLAGEPGNPRPTQFRENVSFGAAFNGESWGRWPNATGELVPLSSTTFGAANSPPRVGPVVFSEIMYHPVNPDGEGGIDADDLEYVEIFNPTNQVVDLTNWAIGGGIGFDFPAGASINPRSTMTIISFNPQDPLNAERLATFRDIYGLTAATQLLGGYSGQLVNSGEHVQLFRPDQPPIDEPDFYPMVLEDEVLYDDMAPWPTGADGGGSSLTRVDVTGWGMDADSWLGLPPSPGTFFAGTPQVASVEVNGNLQDPPDRPNIAQPTSWTTQRSDIRTIVIAFNRLVEADASDFVLTNLGVDAPMDPDQVIDLTGHVTVVDNFVTIAFDPMELPEGAYQLEILPTLTATDGTPLDGDGDGTTGDSFLYRADSENRFYRLTAEWSGDGGVSIFDFNAFAYWFGFSVLGPNAAPAYMDLDGDDGVSIFDFNAFSSNFGQGIVLPPPLLADADSSAVAAVPVASTSDPAGDRDETPLDDASEQAPTVTRRIVVESPRPRIDVRAKQASPGDDDATDKHLEDKDLEDLLDDISEDVFRGWSG